MNLQFDTNLTQFLQNSVNTKLISFSFAIIYFFLFQKKLSQKKDIKKRHQLQIDAKYQRFGT
jgi:hypothetical protein